MADFDSDKDERDQSHEMPLADLRRRMRRTWWLEGILPIVITLVASGVAAAAIDRGPVSEAQQEQMEELFRGLLAISAAIFLGAFWFDGLWMHEPLLRERAAGRERRESFAVRVGEPLPPRGERPRGPASEHIARVRARMSLVPVHALERALRWLFHELHENPPDPDDDSEQARLARSSAWVISGAHVMILAGMLICALAFAQSIVTGAMSHAGQLILLAAAYQVFLLSRHQWYFDLIPFVCDSRKDPVKRKRAGR